MNRRRFYLDDGATPALELHWPPGEPATASLLGAVIASAPDLQQLVDQGPLRLPGGEELTLRMVREGREHVVVVYRGGDLLRGTMPHPERWPRRAWRLLAGGAGLLAAAAGVSLVRGDVDVPQLVGVGVVAAILLTLALFIRRGS